jgi:superoxide dismutase, Cu-Zn family
MTPHHRLHVLALTGGLLLGTFAHAAQTASAELKGADGTSHGTAILTQTPTGVLIKAALKGVTPGEHAFHVHEVGECQPPFTSAGGHFNPHGKKHGLMAEGGPHAGDMPNIHVPASGELTVEVLNTLVTLEDGKPNSLLAGKGTALMLHAKHDDHVSDPAGNAGPRVICGVIR